LTDSTIDSSFANCINSGYLLRVAKALKRFTAVLAETEQFQNSFLNCIVSVLFQFHFNCADSFYKTRPTRLCAEPRYFTAQ